MLLIIYTPSGTDKQKHALTVLNTPAFVGKCSTDIKTVIDS